MKLPYVIDNQSHVLAEILKGLLTEHKGRSLDVAAAYFTVGGFVASRGRACTPNKSYMRVARKRPVNRSRPAALGFDPGALSCVFAKIFAKNSC